ncbi:MAG: segregation and condensation protein A [Oscillospiraceae bacterium]
MKMSFKLEVFEGPLDLLLHLIAKHKLNINDIPIMILVEQYLNYISDMAEQDMEVAGDFLEMAARLIYIKTVSLLPRKEEAEALKKELEGRLIEYSLCKAAAEKMRAAYSGGYLCRPCAYEDRDGQHLQPHP